jgi:alpha-tubulin suppressor-like RCC1 family protein
MAFFLNRQQNNESASNLFAFAFIRKDGSVGAIGHPFYGGSLSPSEIQSTPERIVANNLAFAALNRDGSVRAWGSRDAGGDFSYMPSPSNPKVTKIFSTTNAFAAIRADGSVIAWGRDLSGGQLDKTREKNPEDIQKKIGTNVKIIAASDNAFTVLRRDGSMISWPTDSFGGNARKVSGSFVALASNRYACAGITESGGVKVWGSRDFGGELSSAAEKSLSGGVKRIVATGSAFAALKGNLITHKTPQP